MCELILRKDTGQLLEETILPKLTQGLEVIATFQLHLFKTYKSKTRHIHFGGSQNSNRTDRSEKGGRFE